jgi:hypothetical protein
MPCLLIEAGKQCEDCDTVNNEPNAWKTCDKRVADFIADYQDQLVERYMQRVKDGEIRVAVS